MALELPAIAAVISISLFVSSLNELKLSSQRCLKLLSSFPESAHLNFCPKLWSPRPLPGENWASFWSSIYPLWFRQLWLENSAGLLSLLLRKARERAVELFPPPQILCIFSIRKQFIIF